MTHPLNCSLIIERKRGMSKMLSRGLPLLMLGIEVLVALHLVGQRIGGVRSRGSGVTQAIYTVVVGNFILGMGLCLVLGHPNLLH